MVNDLFYPDEMGGSGRYLSEIAKGLVRDGATVSVISRKLKQEQNDQDVFEGINLYRYFADESSPMDYYQSTMKNVKTVFEEFIDNNQIDMINFHLPLTAMGVLSSKKAKNIKKVYTFHSPWSREYEIKVSLDDEAKVEDLLWFERFQSWTRKKTEEKALKSCEFIMVLSEFMKAQCLTYHPKIKIPFHIFPGGAEIDKFKPAEDREAVRTELSIEQDKTILLTVRGLTPRTGIQNLIDAMPKVVENNPNVKLLIGGGGALREKLEEKVATLGLKNNVSFLGFIEDKDLVKYYQAADYFILPTKHLEGFGLVTTEALSCGLPVLATPVGGTTEILSRFNSELLFRDTSAEAMSSKIIDFTNRDKSKWEKLSKECREYIENNYVWNHVAKKVHRTLKDSIK